MGEAARVLDVELELPEKLAFLLSERWRYKVVYGGRGGLKSWSFARALLLLGIEDPQRILCARETMESMSESVHRLLKDQIDALGIQECYEVQKTKILGWNGTEFLFEGIRTNPRELKSLERIKRVWVEEAEAVTEESWEILTPTIRLPGSEIWVSFNPRLATDATWKRFIVTPPTDAKIVQTSYRDNPWLSQELEKERLDLKARNPQLYRNVWEGECGVLGNVHYDPEVLAKAKQKQREPIARGILKQAGKTVTFEERSDGWLVVYEWPSERHEYTIGADVSEGTDKGDRHKASVLKRGRICTQVARVAPRGGVGIGAGEYGELLVLVALYYNGTAIVGIEKNSMGAATIYAAQKTEYEHLYRYQDPLAPGKSELGWRTTKSSRPLMLSGLGDGMRDGSLVIRAEETHEELSTFVDGPRGPEHADGCHDDEVMALAIAYQVALTTEPVRRLDPLGRLQKGADGPPATGRYGMDCA